MEYQQCPSKVGEISQVMLNVALACSRSIYSLYFP